jgi:hypothetical protein
LVTFLGPRASAFDLCGLYNQYGFRFCFCRLLRLILQIWNGILKESPGFSFYCIKKGLEYVSDECGIKKYRSHITRSSWSVYIVAALDNCCYLENPFTNKVTSFIRDRHSLLLLCWPDFPLSTLISAAVKRWYFKQIH